VASPTDSSESNEKVVSDWRSRLRQRSEERSESTLGKLAAPSSLPSPTSETSEASSSSERRRRRRQRRSDDASASDSTASTPEAEAKVEIVANGPRSFEADATPDQASGENPRACDATDDRVTEESSVDKIAPSRAPNNEDPVDIKVEVIETNAEASITTKRPVGDKDTGTGNESVAGVFFINY